MRLVHAVTEGARFRNSYMTHWSACTQCWNWKPSCAWIPSQFKPIYGTAKPQGFRSSSVMLEFHAGRRIRATKFTTVSLLSTKVTRKTASYVFKKVKCLHSQSDNVCPEKNWPILVMKKKCKKKKKKTWKWFCKKKADMFEMIIWNFFFLKISLHIMNFIADMAFKYLNLMILGIPFYLWNLLLVYITKSFSGIYIV